MTEAFGGPFYQILNPSTQQLVDRLGLRGQGLEGFAAEAIGPGRKIKILRGQFQKLLRAEKLQTSGAPGDLIEANKLKKGIPYENSSEIAEKILKLEGGKPMNLNLFEQLRKKYDI